MPVKSGLRKVRSEVAQNPVFRALSPKQWLSSSSLKYPSRVWTTVCCLCLTLDSSRGVFKTKFLTVTSSGETIVLKEAVLIPIATNDPNAVPVLLGELLV